MISNWYVGAENCSQNRPKWRGWVQVSLTNTYHLISTVRLPPYVHLSRPVNWIEIIGVCYQPCHELIMHCLYVHHTVYVYMIIWLYEWRTRFFPKLKAIHSLRTSPIGCEDFSTPGGVTNGISVYYFPPSVMKVLCNIRKATARQNYIGSTIILSATYVCTMIWR